MAEIKAIKIGNNTYQIGADVNESLANSFTGGVNILRGTRFPQMITDTYAVDESWSYSKFVSFSPDEQSKGDLAFPSDYIDQCPANNECERCGTVRLEACTYGICQTVHHNPVESSLTKIIKTRNTTVGGNVECQTVTRIPLTFSFYARSTGSSSTLRVAPVLF